MSATATPKRPTTKKPATRKTGPLARITELAAKLEDGERQSVLNVMENYAKEVQALDSPIAPSIKEARGAWSALMGAAGRIEARLEAAISLTNEAAGRNAELDDQTVIALDLIVVRAAKDLEAAVKEIHRLRDFIDAATEAMAATGNGKVKAVKR